MTSEFFLMVAIFIILAGYAAFRISQLENEVDDLKEQLNDADEDRQESNHLIARQAEAIQGLYHSGGRRNYL